MNETKSAIAEEVTSNFDGCLEKIDEIRNALKGLVPLCESLEEIYYMEVAIAYMENLGNLCEYEKLIIAGTIDEKDPAVRARYCKRDLQRISSKALDIDEIYTRIMTVYRGEMNMGLRSLIEDALEIIKSLVKAFENCENTYRSEYFI